jgi:CheY-like chemotaxis protein
MLLRLVERCLRRWGWDVDTAASRVDALELIAGGGYELLVCDVNIGADDGVSMASMVRVVWPSLRIVIISGLPENIERARAAGFVFSLGKPFELAALKTAVGEAG